METDGNLSREEKISIDNAITNFILTNYEDSEKPEISYKALLIDLQGQLYEYLVSHKQEELNREVFKIIYGEDIDDAENRDKEL